jgi:hypothetical protein
MRDGQVKQPHPGRKESPSSSTANINHCACDRSVQHDNRSEGRDLMSWATDSASISGGSVCGPKRWRNVGDICRRIRGRNTSYRCSFNAWTRYGTYTVCKHLLQRMVCEDSGRKELSASEEMSFLLLASWSSRGILWNPFRKRRAQSPPVSETQNKAGVPR